MLLRNIEIQNHKVYYYLVTEYRQILTFLLIQK